MTAQWIVLLKTTGTGCMYGPFDDEAQAEHFADFLTTEVDPATVVPLKSPIAELLAWRRNRMIPDVPPKPYNWPPKVGEVWQDRGGDRWICTPTGSNNSYLTCLAKRADDGADEIWRLFGPLTLIMTVPVEDEEPPF